MTERPSRLARALPVVVMAALSVLLMLLVFEVSLRLTQDLFPEGVVPDPAASLFMFSEDKAVGFEHAPNVFVTFPEVVTDAGWNPAWNVSTDARGLRRNVAADLPPERVGICLGDSIMFGAGLNDDETLPSCLGPLVSRALGKRFECLNYGVSNYTTAQEVELFRYKRALDQNPAVVVLEIYTNDFKTSPGRVKVLDGRTQLVQPETSRWLLTGFSDLRLWKLSVASLMVVRDELRRRGFYPHANAKPLKPAQIAAVYTALDTLREMLEPWGVPLLVVSFLRDW